MDEACYCSDFNSGGIPCPPGACPNVPEEPVISSCSCGGQGVIKSRFGVTGNMVGREKWVRCLTCGITGPRAPEKRLAIDGWNLAQTCETRKAG